MKNSNIDYTLIIDGSKHPELSVTNQDKLRKFKRKLKLNRWKVVVLNKAPIDRTAIEKYVKAYSVLLLLTASVKYSLSELKFIGEYINEGGRVLITASSHDEKKSVSNVNEIIQTYGVSVNSDCVIRTNRFEYNHPKEVFIRNGVANRGILEEGGKILEEANIFTDSTKDGFRSDENDDKKCRLDDIKILYPYGATLNVENPSMVAMTSSKFCYPVNQAICSFFNDSHIGSRLVVIGSTEFLHDNYIGREQNMLLAMVILEYLVNEEFTINLYDAKTAEIEDYCQIPDLNYLSELPLSCFQDSEPVPEDIQSLVEQKLFTADSSILPQTLAAYEHLEMPHEKLTLIRPHFENPVPKLKPATCGPILRGPSGPRLELFDLDTEFTPIRTRLMEAASTIIGKTTQDERSMEDIIIQFASITKVPNSEIKSPREILDFVFRRVVTFKMVDSINM